MAMNFKGMIIPHPGWIGKIKKATPPTFVRNSVAYLEDGTVVPNNVPRFKWNDGNGLRLENTSTNILPEEESLLLNAPYTTASLNGVYTFSCKSGVITLSGGATGTVTPNSPQTKTISSATVTLTPATTTSYNQIENKPFPTSFTLGETIRGGELCNLPLGILNISGGAVTIEFEAYINAAVKELTSGNHYLIYASSGGGKNNIVVGHTSANKWGYGLTDNSVNVNYIALYNDTLTAKSWHKFAISWDSNGMSIYIDGSPIGSTVLNYIPQYDNKLYLLNDDNSGTPAWTLIRNITVSKIRRTDAQILLRANNNKNGVGFILDNNVTYVLPLKQDLNAYRVGEV